MLLCVFGSLDDDFGQQSPPTLAEFGKLSTILSMRSSRRRRDSSWYSENGHIKGYKDEKLGPLTLQVNLCHVLAKAGHWIHVDDLPGLLDVMDTSFVS